MVGNSTIEQLIRELKPLYNPKYIYIFGSYAWGKPDESSDLDILIVVNESAKKSHERPVAAYLALKALRIPKDVIVYTLSEFNDKSSDITTLSYKIKSQGRLIYENS